MVVPSTPYDAKGLLKSAIRDDNPVIFMESELMYNMQGEVPEEEYVLPLGKAAVLHQGDGSDIGFFWQDYAYGERGFGDFF